MNLGKKYKRMLINLKWGLKIYKKSVLANFGVLLIRKGNGEEPHQYQYEHLHLCY